MQIIKEINSELWKNINTIVKKRKILVVIHRPLDGVEKNKVNEHFYKKGWGRVKIDEMPVKDFVWTAVELFQDKG